MKDKEKRNKKGSESTIGKIIYGFLLFMPLFAIGVTCGYAMFNKNAKDSYSDDYIVKEYLITDINNYNNDLVYNLQYKSTWTASNTGNKALSYLGLTAEDLDISQGAYDLIANWQLATVASRNVINFKDSDLNVIKQLAVTDTLEFTFSGEIDSAWLNRFTITRTIYGQSKLDNAFYYAVNKVTESPLFIWAENSIIYTTTNTTCNALSITTPFIPLLLSYWLIISVMYFLYDIALMLIWVLHDRIHALKDSIT